MRRHELGAQGSPLQEAVGSRLFCKPSQHWAESWLQRGPCPHHPGLWHGLEVCESGLSLFRGQGVLLPEAWGPSQGPLELRGQLQP